MKKIRLTEEDLHSIINESIKEVLYESRTVRYKIDRIYKALQKSGIGNKVYHDDHWQAKDDYNKVITSLGGDFDYWCENGGYTDYDKSDNMPRSKEYKVRISFEDGDVIGGYMKFMAAGSVEDPFDRYDTCMVLWPERNVDESRQRTVKKGLNEVGEKYNPIKNKNGDVEKQANQSLTPAQKRYAFMRHCENLAKSQGRDNLAKDFDRLAADHWNDNYSFENPNGKPGELTGFWMDYDRPYPHFDYKKGEKPLSNIGHRPGLRKKMDGGFTAKEIAPFYDDKDNKEYFYDGYELYNK